MVSDMAVDSLMDALTDIICGVLINIAVDVLFSGVIIAFEFARSGTVEDFRCWAAFDCRPMAGLDCDDVLQAWIPPCHV